MAGPLAAIVRVDRDQIAMDQSITMTVRIEAPSPLEEAPSPFTGAVGDFLITETKESTPDCGSGTFCREWTYVLETALPGERTLPGLRIPFTKTQVQPGGSQQPEQGVLQTEPITVTVLGGLADLRSDPLALPRPFTWTLLWWALGVIGALLAIGLIARYWPLRKRVEKHVTPTAKPVIAHEWALAELEKLEREDLIGQGRVQEYYYRINALIRRYIELRFHINAGEQTSEEFIRDLQYSRHLSDAHKQLLRQFVASCDPVKYAAQLPSAEDIAWVASSARSFILDTAASASHQSAAAASPVAQEVTP